MANTLRRILYASVLLFSSLLAGCALPRMIDSEVESFVGGDGALTGVGFRFERLPSQQQRSERQDALERMAEQALVEAGLRRDDTTPKYQAQVEFSVVTIAPPVQRRSHSERPIVTANGAVVFAPPLMLMLEPPWYSHTVRVVLRQVENARVAFESTASFDGPWSDSAHLVPVILRAALRDYPNPPTGLRKVVIELPPSGAENAPVDE